MSEHARLESGPVPGDTEGRAWAPSLAPQHRQAAAEEPGRIIDASEKKSWLRAWLGRPFVRLCIGLGIFIFGAIVYDTTVNYGSWTQKQLKAKPGTHKGAAPVPKGADPIPLRPEN